MPKPIMDPATAARIRAELMAARGNDIFVEDPYKRAVDNAIEAILRALEDAK